MPYIILTPAHGLDKLISHLGVCHYITKTHLGGRDTLQEAIIKQYPNYFGLVWFHRIDSNRN
jgi:hypothetical protein